MREPKYQAWLGHAMVQVTGLNFIKNTKGEYEYQSTGFFLDGNNQFTGTGFDLGKAKLREFTGLKDKNGKEIYEGDILKVEGSKRRYVVQWNEEELAFTVDYRYANDYPAEWILSEFRVVLKTFEVIGNIYENPELLEAES